jgi:DNA polymerase
LITIDFETRSEAELLDIGTFNYAAHPTTDVQCLAFSFDDRDDVFLWHRAFPSAGFEERRPPELEELFNRLLLGEEVEAHNSLFERTVWHFVMTKRYGWPEIHPRQWRCSAAKAAAYALPRKLEQLAIALKLPVQKDMAGNRLAVRMAKPRKPLKRELMAARCRTHEEYYRRYGPLWHEGRDDLERLFAYCKQDVVVEKLASAQLRSLSDQELEVWHMDQAINLRGIYCDRAMVEAALEHARQEVRIADQRIEALSLGMAANARKRADFLDWLRAEGIPLPDTQGATLDVVLGAGEIQDPDTGEMTPLPDHVREALEMWRRASRTSVKKYQAMLDRMAEDDRIRDLLRYHGASTGRWSGAGIQPQNFPRGTVKNMDAVCENITVLDRRELEQQHGDVMELLSGALRGALCAPPGKELLVADFSAIEARGTFWLAGDEAALEIFRRGLCIYRDMAGAIYGVADPQSIAKDDPRRQLGKAAVLGLGYQMGPSKFITTCANDPYRIEIDAQFAERVVDTYREQHKPVKRLWYALEAAAVEAVRRGPGAPPVQCRNTLWAVRGRFLHCRLPSGRLLSYCDPWIEMEMGAWGEYPKLKFWGVDTYTKQWSPQTTYGGKLTENVVQALCRDLMAEAMLRLEARGYPMVLSVHDEVVAEVPDGWGDLKEFERLMSEVPKWAQGMPIAAEGWRGRRYRK